MKEISCVEYNSPLILPCKGYPLEIRPHFYKGHRLMSFFMEEFHCMQLLKCVYSLSQTHSHKQQQSNNSMLSLVFMPGSMAFLVHMLAFEVKGQCWKCRWCGPVCIRDHRWCGPVCNRNTGGVVQLVLETQVVWSSLY